MNMKIIFTSLIFNNYEGMSNIKVVNNEIFKNIIMKKKITYITLDDQDFLLLKMNPKIIIYFCRCYGR